MPETARRVRVDAQRNLDSLLVAAKAEFGEHGVDVPVRDIATRAGVGVGTVYRHFPRRSDLVVAVFRHEVDACADAAGPLVEEHAPGEALRRWLLRFTSFVATKRGLSSALHSGDPAYDGLHDYFAERFGPTLDGLLDRAVAAGDVRSGVDGTELLVAVTRLCSPGSGHEPAEQDQRMVELLLDGLRYGA